jgi:hypothetical protein
LVYRVCIDIKNITNERRRNTAVAWTFWKIIKKRIGIRRRIIKREKYWKNAVYGWNILFLGKTSKRSKESSVPMVRSDSISLSGKIHMKNKYTVV